MVTSGRQEEEEEEEMAAMKGESQRPVGANNVKDKLRGNKDRETRQKNSECIYLS